MQIEIINPQGNVSYRRPHDHPDVLEALQTPGYSVRGAEPKGEPQVRISAVLACGWTQDSDGSAWATGCGHLFEVNDGTPKENGMCWCCFCGRELKETPYTDDEQANAGAEPPAKQKI
jgi:hypothetical protein